MKLYHGSPLAFFNIIWHINVHLYTLVLMITCIMLN